MADLLEDRRTRPHLERMRQDDLGKVKAPTASLAETLRLEPPKDHASKLQGLLLRLADRKRLQDHKLRLSTKASEKA